MNLLDSLDRLLGPYAFGTAPGGIARLAILLLSLTGAFSPFSGGEVNTGFLTFSVLAALLLFADLRAIERRPPRCPSGGTGPAGPKALRKPFEPELDTLGLGQEAGLGEIKSAYRRIARECHPDVPLGEHLKRDEDRFSRATDAYKTLVARRRRR